MFRGLFKKIDQLITGRGKIDDELYDELEELLIQSDVGVHTAMRIVEDLRQATRRSRLSTADDVLAIVRDATLVVDTRNSLRGIRSEKIVRL